METDHRPLVSIISKQSSPKDMREYWAVKDELSTADGLIFKGEAIVISPGLRKEVLRQIHQGHVGIERSKLRARELVFWPGMSKQIEDVVSSCAVCLQNFATVMHGNRWCHTKSPSTHAKSLVRTHSYGAAAILLRLSTTTVDTGKLRHCATYPLQLLLTGLNPSSPDMGYRKQSSPIMGLTIVQPNLPNLQKIGSSRM